MKEIKLTNSNLTALVDDDDYLFLKNWSWRYVRISRVDYVFTIIRDLNTRKSVKVYLHRLIMGMPGTMIIDHIDRNGLNNQRSNLRICTHRQNALNCKRGRRNKKSKYMGVSINKAGKIYAFHNIKGRMHIFGYFDTEEDAAKARDLALDKIDRKYCIFNFPEIINDATATVINNKR